MNTWCLKMRPTNRPYQIYNITLIFIFIFYGYCINNDGQYAILGIQYLPIITKYTDFKGNIMLTCPK